MKINPLIYMVYTQIYQRCVVSRIYPNTCLDTKTTTKCVRRLELEFGEFKNIYGRRVSPAVGYASCGTWTARGLHSRRDDFFRPAAVSPRPKTVFEKKHTVATSVQLASWDTRCSHHSFLSSKGRR